MECENPYFFEKEEINKEQALYILKKMINKEKMDTSSILSNNLIYIYNLKRLIDSESPLEDILNGKIKFKKAIIDLARICGLFFLLNKYKIVEKNYANKIEYITNLASQSDYINLEILEEHDKDIIKIDKDNDEESEIKPKIKKVFSKNEANSYLKEKIKEFSKKVKIQHQNKNSILYKILRAENPETFSFDKIKYAYKKLNILRNFIDFINCFLIIDEIYKSNQLALDENNKIHTITRENKFLI